MFNELSVFPLAKDMYESNDKVVEFAKTMGKAKSFNFSKIRSEKSTAEIQLTENRTLYDWLNTNSEIKEIEQIYKPFLFGVFVQPFINEDDEIVEDKYIKSNFFFENEQNGFLKTDCLGLAAAYLYGMPCISLNSSNVWKKNTLEVVIEDEDKQSREVVYNVYANTCFSKPVIETFVEELGKVKLIETKLASEDKKISISSHHGEKELKELCNKLKNSPYVTEMYSTNWGGKNFIRKYHKNGKIEIVLYKTERQYALEIQTTGRNLRETKAIAKKLEKRYA